MKPHSKLFFAGLAAAAVFPFFIGESLGGSLVIISIGLIIAAIFAFNNVRY